MNPVKEHIERKLNKRFWDFTYAKKNSKWVMTPKTEWSITPIIKELLTYPRELRSKMVFNIRQQLKHESS